MGKSKQSIKLSIIAFVGAITPINLVLIATGVPQVLQGKLMMPAFIKTAHQIAFWYIPFILLPGIALIVYSLVKSKTESPVLFNLMKAGLLGGFVGTFALDTFRQLGFIHKWLPMDTVKLFGNMIAGPGSPELVWVSTGLLYHFLNGTTFGLIFVLVFGVLFGVNKWWQWALVWALVVEVFMMVLPPMAPTNGLFGVNTGGPGFFLITLIAHIGFGLTLGLIVQNRMRGMDRESS